MIRKLITLGALTICAFSSLKASSPDDTLQMLKWLQKAVMSINDPIANAIKDVNFQKIEKTDGCQFVRKMFLSDAVEIKYFFDYHNRLDSSIKEIVSNIPLETIREKLFNKLTLEIKDHPLISDLDDATEFIIKAFKALDKIDQQAIMADSIANSISKDLFPGELTAQRYLDPQADQDEDMCYGITRKDFRNIFLCQLLLAIVLIDKNTSSELLEEFYSLEVFKEAVDSQVRDFLEKTYPAKN
jgi:hypothetical protein